MKKCQGKGNGLGINQPDTNKQGVPRQVALNVLDRDFFWKVNITNIVIMKNQEDNSCEVSATHFLL